MGVIQVAPNAIKPKMCGSVRKISAYDFAYEAPKHYLRGITTNGHVRMTFLRKMQSSVYSLNMLSKMETNASYAKTIRF